MSPLPGSIPYDNVRPINIPQRYSGDSLFDCVVAMFPGVRPEQWRDWFRWGHILDGEVPVSMDTPVCGGQQYSHVFPDTIEPDVDASIEILWEDSELIAVHKPAPLPVHPSGRFNRNTATSLLRTVYGVSDLRVVHRLDANTSGILLFARNAAAATALRNQFEQDEIRKLYLVRCIGQPAADHFTCDQPIGKQRGPGGSRAIDPAGLSAHTEFQVLCRMRDGTSLLKARPSTGRTHQIRLHLWSMGVPVFGDPVYLSGRKLGATHTLAVHDDPMCLHASKIALKHPTSHASIEFTAADPLWFRP